VCGRGCTRWLHAAFLLNNRRILEYLRHVLGCDEAAIHAWCAAWIEAGFGSLETLLAADTQRGDYCFGNAPTLADVYLVPQVERARGFKVDLTPDTHMLAAEQACLGLPAFSSASPSLQPGAV
jgi:maleylpyruvate isomerase